MSRRLLLVALLLCLPLASAGQEAAGLTEARARYNAGDLDGAIAAAAIARARPELAHAASLVIGRAYLERFRSSGDAVDLESGREALASVDAAALAPADRSAWLIGVGQSLFHGGQSGAAAEMFETALARRETLGLADARMLLDWWASAIDAAAVGEGLARRTALFARIDERMAGELAASPGSAPANYWLAAAARGAGDPGRAWDLASAGWVRARLAPETMSALRADLDRLVLEGVVPELARARGVDEAALVTEWTAFKDLWP